MKPTFITVDSFDHLLQAEMLLMMLTQSGLTARLADSQVVAMQWTLANTIGGIKVQVLDTQAEQATEIATKLRTQNNSRVSKSDVDDEDACLACGQAMSEDQSVCSQCGWSYDDADT